MAPSIIRIFDKQDMPNARLQMKQLWVSMDQRNGAKISSCTPLAMSFHVMPTSTAGRLLLTGRVSPEGQRNKSSGDANGSVHQSMAGLQKNLRGYRGFPTLDGPVCARGQHRARC
eukprot:scaffold292463_cov48-Prasinocladus_malaysianus.AAC.1